MACKEGCCQREAPPKHEDFDDDIWGDGEVVANADVMRSHEKQGYLDGITSAQNEGLQNGFDAAYPDGAQLGIRVGRILSACMGDEDLLKKAKEELNIRKVLQSEHFGDDLVLERHHLIEKWENIVGIRN